jgi:plasmid stability protein
MPLSEGDKGETMTVIELPDDQAAALQARAAAGGLGLEAWLGRLAAGEQKNTAPQGAVSVLDEMNALRARVKPDPEGWTTRDYVQHGRR